MFTFNLYGTLAMSFFLNFCSCCYCCRIPFFSLLSLQISCKHPNSININTYFAQQCKGCSFFIDLVLLVWISSYDWLLNPKSYLIQTWALFHPGDFNQFYPNCYKHQLLKHWIHDQHFNKLFMFVTFLLFSRTQIKSETPFIYMFYTSEYNICDVTSFELLA